MMVRTEIGGGTRNKAVGIIPHRGSVGASQAFSTMVLGHKGPDRGQVDTVVS